MKITFKHRK